MYNILKTCTVYDCVFVFKYAISNWYFKIVISHLIQAMNMIYIFIYMYNRHMINSLMFLHFNFSYNSNLIFITISFCKQFITEVGPRGPYFFHGYIEGLIISARLD